MSIEVTMRHEVKLGKPVQEFAQGKAEEIKGMFEAVEHVQVVVGMDGPLFAVDVKVQGGRGMNADAKDKNADGRAAITGAFAKVEVQLRKTLKKNNEKR